MPRHRLWFFISALSLIALAAVGSAAAQGSNFKVLYNFSGGADGANPGRLTMDAFGNLYGTTASAGNMAYCTDNPSNPGCGTAFKLSQKNSAWIFSQLYAFTDTAGPSGVILDGQGVLYGATSGGSYCEYGCGTVYKLTPPLRICKSAYCPWTETALYRFTGGNDGIAPSTPTFDQAGNLVGATHQGGSYGCIAGCGTIYKLTRSASGWTSSVLYLFDDDDDGNPTGSLVLDAQGRLYGTTQWGGNPNCGPGNSCGTVFQLTDSGQGWTENIIYIFENGDNAPTGVIFDNSGNLYGATRVGGLGGGTVFELTPSSGNWAYSLLYSFSGLGGPTSSLTRDNSGNLYGTTYSDGPNRAGTVFKLTPSSGGWIYTSLHDFTGGSDGGGPFGGVILDANGNLYGTTLTGGTGNCRGSGCGIVFEITP